MNSPSSSVADQCILDFLHDRDVFCPLCKYNLRNLTIPRCPECGYRLRLSIGLVEPSQAPWILALVGLAASAGLGVLAALLMWVGVKGGLEPWVQVMFSYLIACIPLSLCFVLLRRRVLRLHSLIQWIFAGITFLAPLAVLFVFFRNELF